MPLLTRSPRRTGGRARRLRPLGAALLGFEGALALSSGYLLALLLAARDSIRNPAAATAVADGEPLRLAVLVPAHNEESGIEATLESLAACDYPAGSRRVVVIADNCTDGTVACCSKTETETWERTDTSQRGKGFALGWALRRLFEDEAKVDAVVMVDADCTVSPNMLRAIDRRLRSGAGAVQVDYVADNPQDSHVSALRFGAFALADTVRFLGKQRLGLSCGLVGTGMGFRRELLERTPWNATGLVEDGEYHLHLVLAGERAEFVPEASVSQAVPTSMRASSEQQARWERGRLQLIRNWSPRLLAAGVAERDVVRVQAGLECLLPPQSLIAAGNLGSLLAGLLLGHRRLVALSALSLAAQATFILAGLRLVRAPAQVYRALLLAPLLVASKMRLYARFLLGQGPTGWTRTERETAEPQP
ncbi:MAG TPA: glycosyltransferase family 2 protein [Solirubrobacterales bacterium]|jgi:GT2 family glycosyltransferase